MNATDRELTIQAPQLVSRGRRASDTMVTGVMWIVYMYLWVPLISLGAWLLGFEFAYDAMVRAGGAAGLLNVLWWYGIVIALIVVAVTAWSASNRIRFRQGNRRRASSVVDDAQLLDRFNVSTMELECLRHARVVEIAFGDNAELMQVSEVTAPARCTPRQSSAA